jgi:hypothetical protein
MRQGSQPWLLKRHLDSVLEVFQKVIHLESMEGPRVIVRNVFAGHLREPIWLLHRWTPQGRTGSPSEEHTSERGVQMLFLSGLWET